jgi:ABC-type glycerol-3-phosphate transport system substrate-binding protein
VTWESNNKAETELIRQFQEEYPQITFERSASFDSLTASIGLVPQPDLINVDVTWDLARAAGSGKLADLSELWELSGLRENVPPALQQASEFQGHQFYIPVGVGWKAIYYNKQIFADYNLSPPETWEEFLVICDTLLADGEVPLSISGIDPWAIHGWFEYLNLRINGTQFHLDLLAGIERYDDPRVRVVMETWQSLFAKGYFIAEPGMERELTSLTGIVRGGNGTLDSQQAVMVLASTYAYGNLPAPFQNEIAFFRFPVMDPSMPVAEVANAFGYVVPLGAEHLPSTLLFLEYVSSQRAQLLAAQSPLYMSAYYAPVRNDVDTEPLSADQRSALTLLHEADEIVAYLEFGLPAQMRDTTYTYFRSFVSKPEDIDFFITKMEETRQQMVSQGVFATE